VVLRSGGTTSYRGKHSMIEMKIQPVSLDQSGAESPLVATLITWLTTFSHPHRMTIGSDSWEQNKSARMHFDGKAEVHKIVLTP
jgi:hypothetical protein